LDNLNIRQIIKSFKSTIFYIVYNFL